MIDVNEGILNLISSDYRVSRQIYDSIKQRWPQINGMTRVEYVDRPEVYIHQPVQRNIADDMIRVSINGWKRFIHLLFKRAQYINLDDPDKRWQYQTEIWRSPLTLIRPYYWRFVGRVFRRKDWYNRGTEMTMNPAVPVNMGQTDVVRLERFGWRNSYYGGMDYLGEFGEIICAYYPPRDTFFVWKR